MIHDVDESLRLLVKQEALQENGVEIAFDAPTREWVSRRNAPSVDLYLYDIREDLARRAPAWEDVRDGSDQVTGRRQPPRRYRLAYLVTAWTQRPEDEHRLLASLLSCFIINAMTQPADLDGTLAKTDLPVYIEVAQPPTQDRSIADVWSALGGELKPSLDVVVTAPFIIDRDATFGPPVLKPPTLRVETPDGAKETVPSDAPPDDDGPARRTRGLRTR